MGVFVLGVIVVLVCVRRRRAQYITITVEDVHTASPLRNYAPVPSYVMPSTTSANTPTTDDIDIEKVCICTPSIFVNRQNFIYKKSKQKVAATPTGDEHARIICGISFALSIISPILLRQIDWRR